MQKDRVMAYSIFDSEGKPAVVIKFGQVEYLLPIDQAIMLGTTIIQAAGLSASKTLVMQFAEKLGLDPTNTLIAYNDHLAKILEQDLSSEFAS